MTMKLSEKDINRLYAQVWMNQEDLPQDEIFGFETLEFQSDDFEDCVMLTVEEAIFTVRVLHTVWDSSCVSMNQDCYNKIKEINRKLILQVNKAEGKDE